MTINTRGSENYCDIDSHTGGDSHSDDDIDSELTITMIAIVNDNSNYNDNLYNDIIHNTCSQI